MNAMLAENGLDVRRAGRITGSRVSAILGLNPYQTRADVLRAMVREAHGAPAEFVGNEATRYGQAREPEALAMYEQARGVMTHGAELVIHPTYDFLAVTPDGLVGADGMVECKAPFRGNYKHLDDVPYYRPQVQLQMACTGRKWCDFLVLQRDGTLHITHEVADPCWLPSVMPALKAYMADFAEACAEPAQHLAALDRDDEDWSVLAAQWRHAKAEKEAADARLDGLRDALLAMAGEFGAKGCGVQVIRAERAGSVAYARAIKELLPDADLSAYTGKPTIVYTVKECK